MGLINMEDLDTMCGTGDRSEEDPNLCECGARRSVDCTGEEGVCLMMPSATVMDGNGW
jgi:hypothetical protein